MKLKNEEKVIWMSIADEGSGAHLKAMIEKVYYMSEVKLEKAIGMVNKCFERWGLPKQIKIDNGWPFVHPNNSRVPTYAKLWWIGLGIKVIQNAPRCPQQNGIVECLQGTLYRWTGPLNQTNVKSLQARIDEESDFQRNHYRIPSKQNKTRLELFPELETNPRKYNPDLFDIQLVYNFLSEKVWKRKVMKGGVIKFFGAAIFVGRKFAGVEVTFTFDPLEVRWLIRKKDGTLINTSNKGIPTEEDIRAKALSVQY